MAKRLYIGSGALLQLQKPHVEYDPEDEAGTAPENTDFVTIATVRSVSFAGDAREALDATVIDAVTDIEDSQGGLRNAGEVNFIVHFRPGVTSFDDLDAVHASGEERHFRLLYDRLPNKPADHFTGFLSGWEGPNVTPREGMVKAGKIKVTSASVSESPKRVNTA